MKCRDALKNGKTRRGAAANDPFVQMVLRFVIWTEVYVDTEIWPRKVLHTRQLYIAVSGLSISTFHIRSGLRMHGRRQDDDYGTNRGTRQHTKPGRAVLCLGVRQAHCYHERNCDGACRHTCRVPSNVDERFVCENGQYQCYCVQGKQVRNDVHLKLKIDGAQRHADAYASSNGVNRTSTLQRAARQASDLFSKHFQPRLGCSSEQTYAAYK